MEWECEVYRESKMNERQEKFLQMLVVNLRERDHLGNTGIDERIVLEGSVKKQCVWNCGLHLRKTESSLLQKWESI